MECAAAWKQPEAVLPSEGSQRANTTYDSTYMENLKYDRNEPTFKTEAETEGTEWWLPRGGGWGRDRVQGCSWQIQAFVHRMDKPGPTV